VYGCTGVCVWVYRRMCVCVCMCVCVGGGAKVGGEDRAKQAYDTFVPLDGQFDANVVCGRISIRLRVRAAVTVGARVRLGLR